MNIGAILGWIRRTSISTWRRWLQVRTLLVLARVPLLVVLVAAFLAWQVEQIRELLLIAALGERRWFYLALGTAAALGLSAWYSTRTLYRFRWPDVNNEDIQQGMGRWLPRFLAVLAPLSVAVAYLGFAEDLPEGEALKCALWFFALAVTLFLFTTFRRPVWNRVVRSHRLRLDDRPEIAGRSGWGRLRSLRFLHYLALGILLIAMLVGSGAPALMQSIGPLALVFGFAAMLIAASTWPVFTAAKFDFPLVTFLVAIGFVWAVFDANDNHRVRLTAGHSSNDPAPSGLSYEASWRATLDDYFDEWWQQRRTECNDQVFFVSAAGGGIRAALWTATVLGELDAKTDGKLWRCTVAVSGVSGGSLGLASFAALKADLDGAALHPSHRDGLLEMLQTDFLSPVIGSMFGLDLLQRLLPGAWFTDRGQALEDSWIRAYRAMADDNAGFTPRSFSAPLAQSWCSDDLCLLDRDDAPELLPALFLNTTIVDSGRRLVQHPFARLSDSPHPFPGSSDGFDWFPAQFPVSSAVLNSARFTMVSPAGTVEHSEPRRVTLGQVVDGGYFENSGTTTLASLIERFQRRHGQASIRAVHISNGTGVAAFMKPGVDGRSPDACSADGEAALGNATVHGEALAPLLAILATRDARADAARVELEEAAVAANPHKSRLWHYRLCRGTHTIPLGWTIGVKSGEEMRNQLVEGLAANGARLPEMTRQIAALLRQESSGGR